jgi:uncharacterized protein
MEIIGKGELSLEVNPSRTVAALLYQNDPAGEAWTRERILDLLRQGEILEFVNPISIEKALAALRRAGPAQVRVVVAEGVAPAADPEAIRWEDLSIPADLVERAEETIRLAPPPAVYAWRYRKRRLEAEPGKRRGAAEPRIVIEPVKEERKVDATLRRTGYASKGALVATIGTAREGTPGRTFRGEPLPAPPPGKPELYYGAGFDFKDDRLFARESGLVRIGVNWVDIVPFAAADFSLSPAPDGSDALLSFNPGPLNRLDALVERVFTAAGRLGFKRDELISPDSVKSLLRGAVDNNLPLTDRPLCKPVDAVCRVTVTEDKLSAFLTLKKGRGRGRPLTLADIQARIKSAAIARMNIIQARDDIKAFFTDQARRELVEYELASGTPPLPGEPGAIEWEVKFSSEAERKKVLARYARMPDAEKTFPSLKDFPLALVKELAVVAPESKMARLVPPQRGHNGVDVHGRTLEGAMGRGIDVLAFEHVKKYGLYLVSEIHGYLEFGKKDDAYCLRVRPHQDARAVCEASLDGMQAWLTIVPHRGYGEPISSPQVHTLLREERIVAGLKEKLIERAVTAAQDGKPVDRLLVAEGRPPVHAEGSRLVPKVNRDQDRHVKILADGRADYKSVSNIPIVRAGDLVAEIIPPLTRTENGFDIYGRVLLARTRAEDDLPPLVNVRRVPGPAGLVNLFAEKDGEFIVTPTAAGVRQLHVIAGDVGLESGNIDFPGSVHVEGSVREGFRVFSKGKVTVNNQVEEALVSAAGDINILQGVKGRKDAVVRTRGGITCLFAEHARLLAVGDIALERSALNCTIKCNGRLDVGKVKGTLMGGTARARLGMTLINLGSPAEARTIVSFGQDYILGDRIESEEKEVEKLKTRIREIDRLMPNMSRVRPEDAAKLALLRDEKLKLLKMIDERNVALFNMREKFEVHAPSAIVVRGTVYPGVTIESHGRQHTVRAEAQSVQYTFDPKTGAIEEKPIVFSRRFKSRAAAGLEKTALRPADAKGIRRSGQAPTTKGTDQGTERLKRK